MTSEIVVTVCICTFRRPHIADTLRSLAQLHMEHWRLYIIVADNDETPSAREIVNAVASETGLEIRYIHAPSRNISIARNACLNALTTPLAAFIDDDELVTPGWLAAMLNMLETSRADAVLGPVTAIYDPKFPRWLREGDFHSVYPVRVQSAILTGYSCNVLFRTDSPALRGLRFREELGRSGGEDTVFFAAVVKAGGIIAYAPQAIVTEAVTHARATLRWLLKRRFRSGQTHGLLLLEMGESAVTSAGKASIKLMFCILMALLNIMRPLSTRFWMLRGALHAGAIARLLGVREADHYG